MSTGMPSSVIEKVSPNRAAEWLGRNNRNFRKLVEADAQRLARAIMTDRWELTNDAITFDVEGNLTNGQHRLRACVIANKPITVAVIRGLPSDTYMDTGKARTAGQLLISRGHSGSKLLPAAARLMWFWSGPGLDALTSHKHTIDNGEILAIVERHQGLTDSILKVGRLRRGMGGSPLAFVHYIGSHGHPDSADLFLYGLETGDGLKTDDACYYLRERFVDIASRRTHMPQPLMLKLIIKCWNRWAQNKPIKSFVGARANDVYEAIVGAPERAK